ncbi:MAG: Cof-type HAD-IIB family hydrolase [Oscillospiraceae bacterium]
MSDRLYISDLDGTLLNSQGVLTTNSVEQLNEAISRGVNFTVATARTAATALEILKNVNISLPIILMNGVCVFDIQDKKYLQAHLIEKASLKTIFSTFKNNDLDGFVFSIENDQLFTFYERVRTKNAEEFIKERVEKYKKKFTQVDDFSQCEEKNVVYVSVSNKAEVLDAAYNDLILDKNLNVEYYRDTYNEDFWYLEICSAKASKFNAVNFIKHKYDFKHVTSFGDNLNDISMFSASDESFAVENAKDEVKKSANSIIGKNTQDAVAVWINKNGKVN